MTDITVTLSKHEYDKLVRDSKAFHRKQFNLLIKFTANDRFSSFVESDINYLDEEELTKGLQLVKDMIEEVHLGIKPILIPKDKTDEVNTTIYTRIINYFNKKQRNEDNL